MTRSRKANSRNAGCIDATAVSVRPGSTARPLDSRNLVRDAAIVGRSALAGATDDRLVALAARGQQAAWAAIVERHLASLVGYAWYVLNDRAEAEDVAQETLIRLLDKVGSWRPDEAHLRTWLHRVATNLCIDKKRKLGRLVRLPLQRLEEVPDRSTLEVDIGRARVVAGALARLPRRQRFAIVLAHYQGFSNPEVAQVMNTTVDSVESMLARARRELRRTLEPIIDQLLEET